MRMLYTVGGYSQTAVVETIMTEQHGDVCPASGMFS